MSSKATWLKPTILAIELDDTKGFEYFGKLMDSVPRSIKNIMYAAANQHRNLYSTIKLVV